MKCVPMVLCVALYRVSLKKKKKRKMTFSETNCKEFNELFTDKLMVNLIMMEKEL